MVHTLIFDTETTGLALDFAAPAWDTDKWPRLVQLAWATYTSAGALVEEVTLVVQPDGFTVPQEAARVHGITDAQARATGTPLAEVLGRFRSALSEAHLVVGHNLNFDLHVVDAECVRSGETSPFIGLGTTCTMKGAATYCKERGVTDGKWPTLEELYGVVAGRLLRSPGEHHKADKDVWATATCYWELSWKGHLPLPEPYTPEYPPETSERPTVERTAPASQGSAPGQEGALWNAGYFVDELRDALVKQGVPGHVLGRFQQRISAFRVSGLPLSPEHPDPTLAVAHNYVVRGIPTRASIGLSRSLLASAFGAAFLGEEGEAPDVKLDLHRAAFAGLDVDEFTDVLRLFPEVSLGEVAESAGSVPYVALRLLLSLTEAAQVHRTLLHAITCLGVPFPDQAVKVHIAGRSTEWAEAVVGDLDDLLRHLYTLRNNQVQGSLLVPVAEPREADVVVQMGAGDEQASGHLVLTLTPACEPPDPDVLPKATGETGSDDGAESSEQLVPYLTRLWMAAPIAYPALGTIEEGRGEEQFSFSSSGVQDALVYVLQNAFRKADFRPGQAQIVDRALRGLDVIGLLPTGGGKSLTYQLCALLQPGVTVVVDPINSLMRDQHDKLVGHGITACAYINAFNDRDERKANMERLSAGLLLIAFVSPERFQIQTFRTALAEAASNGVAFTYAVIDEAHCVSEWGHDFRHTYLKLADDLRRFCTTRWARLPLFGLTATASFDVLADVQRELGMREDAVVTLPPEAIDRKELHFRVLRVEADVDPKAPHYEREKVVGQQKHQALRGLIGDMPGALQGRGLDVGPAGFFGTLEGRYPSGGVVFCPTKSDKLMNGVLSVREGLQSEQERLPLEIGVFFGGGDDETVENKAVQVEAGKALANQIRFLDDRLNLMIATKAFGMGIDKPNIRYTVHYTFPSSVESFYQEAGRAGRDRKPSLCTILYHPEDIQANLDFHEAAFKGVRREREILSELLSEVRYEPEFFLKSVARRLSEEFKERVSLGLFPVGKPGQDPFMLFVNGPWSDDPAKRVSYGALLLKGLKKWQKKLSNATPAASDALLDRLREVILEEAGGADPLTWLRTACQPGIEALMDANGDAVHTLRIGFSNDVVNEITERLKETGNDDIKSVVVRHAYKFCDGPEDFLGNLDYRYRESSGFARKLALDKGTREYLRYAFYQIRDAADTQRAIYRLTLLGIVDDYVVDYAQRQVVVTFRAKPLEEYRENFRSYLRRYLGVMSTSEWLQRVDGAEVESPLKRHLWALLDFVYEEIKQKRVLGIEYMRDLCEAGTAEGDGAFRENIVYYFTSKYARLDFLPKDLDYGKEERLATVKKYIDYVFNPPDGLGGQIDNAKHLRGACARLLLGQSGENAALLLLNAFSILALETAPSESAEGTLRKPQIRDAVAQYRRAYRRYMGTEPWDELASVLTLFAKKTVDINPSLQPLMASLAQEWMLYRTVSLLRDVNMTLTP